MGKIKINRYFIVSYEANVPNYRVSGNIDIITDGRYFQGKDIIEYVKKIHNNAVDITITFVIELCKEDFDEFIKE